MGAWGMSPFDNDDFGDVMGQVIGKVSRPLEAELQVKLKEARQRSADPFTKWAAVGLVIWAYHSGFLVDDRNMFIDQALELVEELEREGSDEWRDPAAFRRMLKKVARHLHDMRGRYSSPVIMDGITSLFEGRKK